MRGLALLALLGIAVAAVAARPPDINALGEARKEADAANQRSQELERQARAATSAAARARAEGEALAARIEAAEADLTAAEQRIAIISRLQEAQQARLAERQGPLVRLVAALQTMSRRPPALALVQPGSVQDTVRVRALLAATLPEIRRRTAALSAEVNYANALRSRADQARGALQAGRESLAARRAALASFENAQRSRSSALAGLSLTEGDRALALGEQARNLEQNIDRGAQDARLAADLGALPGPAPRPGSERDPDRPRLPYALPIRGRLVTGVGEISDSGVHSRGLTLATAANAQALAPVASRIIFAAPFRGYGNVLILDHGGGWTTVITGLASLDVARGATVARGAVLGRAAAANPRVTIELRHAGRPVPLAQLLSA